MVRRQPCIILTTLAVLLLTAGCGVVARPGASTPALPSPGTPGASNGSGFVGHSGTQLTVGGQPYQAVSVDAYELATQWGVNAGCGGMLSDAALDAFFAALPAGAPVRLWGYQGSMATDPSTRTRAWGPLDRVVAAAARHGARLIVSLGNQAGNCDDGHWKDAAWYEGGYRTVYPGDASTVATVSYWDWVHEIVSRYRASTAVAIWELVNEPEASSCAVGYAEDACYAHLSCSSESGAAAALRSFYDVVGTEVHRLDPNHLVESGALGGPQCGWTGGDAATINASPGIDVVSYHDYAESQVLSPDFSGRLAEAQALGKPLLVGELGVQATMSAPGCRTAVDRRALVDAKAQAMLQAGAATVLLWDWVPDAQMAQCTFDLGTGDPTLGLLRSSP